jgi:hypothetical protein
MEDEFTVIDTVAAHTLEDGDNIVYKGEPVTLVLVNDNGDHIYIEWEAGLDTLDDRLDPHAEVDLWMPA